MGLEEVLTGALSAAVPSPAAAAEDDNAPLTKGEARLYFTSIAALVMAAYVRPGVDVVGGFKFNKRVLLKDYNQGELFGLPS